MEFLKGHGTENDFVLLPDPDGTIDLTPERVRALCDRRAGIGADGVLRVVRTAALDLETLLVEEVAPFETPRSSAPQDKEQPSRNQPEWFMDYRNSDGSLSEMCGNGIRVFAHYLAEAGLATLPVEIGTRDGVKVVSAEGDAYTADVGPARIVGETKVSVGDRAWPAVHVDVGNPHAVVFVDSLDEAGPLLEEPAYDATVFPEGANVEFVVRRGGAHVAMRVHERGSGETRSCGTGACAAMVASAVADGRGPGSTYDVDVPGGRLRVAWTDDGRVLLTGPAVIVARGTTDL